jgi:hypothetical protein
VLRRHFLNTHIITRELPQLTRKKTAQALPSFGSVGVGVVGSVAPVRSTKSVLSAIVLTQ